MHRVLLAAGGLFLAHAALPAQTSDGLTFEVASVRHSPPPDPNGRVFFGPPRGGPGTRDPEQITWTNAALRNVLITAYDVQIFQINAPDWFSTERYDIVAKVPPGATKERVNVMWQNLLKERFGMVLHRESREFSVDELTIAKGGAKLQKTDLGPDPDPFSPAAGPEKRDKNGFPEMNGYGAIISVFPTATGATATMRAKGLTLSDFATRLGQQLRHPVIDKTGLTGRYDFTLEYTPDLSSLPPFPRPPGGTAAPNEAASDPGSTLATAVEKQLGLKLTSGRAKLDVIVVDRAEKDPTAN